jgi:hypothetical protein
MGFLTQAAKTLKYNRELLRKSSMFKNPPKTSKSTPSYIDPIKLKEQSSYSFHVKDRRKRIVWASISIIIILSVSIVYVMLK